MPTKIMIGIPAYNEEKTLGRVLDEIKAVKGKLPGDLIIHVQDDGSKDKTVEVAKAGGAVVHSNGRNRGLAYTFKEEIKHFLASDAQVFIHTDADGQYVAADMPRMVAKLQEGYDLVLGSRFRGKIEKMPIMKRFGNKAFALTLSRMTGAKITDSTTGFRAFTREVAEEIHFINTFTYTQEQIIKAAKLKFHIAEVPIRARKTRDSRLFGSSIEYAIKAWINILRIYRDFNPLKFFGVIGLLMMGLGFLLGLGFIIAYVAGYIDIDRHIPSLLLATLLFLTGLQIILFGFLADKHES